MSNRRNRHFAWPSSDTRLILPKPFPGAKERCRRHKAPGSQKDLVSRDKEGAEGVVAELQPR